MTAEQTVAIPGEAFRIGSPVVCHDGDCGKLARVVIDPVADKVTHLAVDGGKGDVGRLVPVGLASSAEGSITLNCTIDEFRGLEAAEAVRFVEAGAVGRFGYEPGQTYVWPYTALPLGGFPGTLGSGAPVAITYDKLPMGKVQIRRGDRVHALDGEIGKVEGLVVDPEDYEVTHFFLQEGHLWGKRRVAIPISVVDSVTDTVNVKLSKDQIKDLPAADLESEGAS